MSSTLRAQFSRYAKGQPEGRPRTQRVGSPSEPNLRQRTCVTLKTVPGDVKRISKRKSNILFVFVPAGFAVQYTGQAPSVVFAVNLLAVLPSSRLMGIGLKSVKMQYGAVVQALLYMTFGNVVNLVTSIILLRKRQIKLLQTSLIGGILSNMHLMLGLGFISGGIRTQEETYNETMSSLFGSLLTLSVAGLVLPTASQLLATPVAGGIVQQSRAIAIVFILVYFGLIYFQLYTHHRLFAEIETQETLEEEEETRRPDLMVSSAIAVIAVSTTLVGFNTYYAVNSMEELLNTTGLTTSFAGIVLLPLFTNDLEPIEAAYRGEMDRCLQATVGKCIQATLFVIPLIIIISWGMKIDEMTLYFDGFDVAALFSSALYIAFLTSNGKSNWFEGVALLAMFLIISISAYYIE